MIYSCSNLFGSFFGRFINTLYGEVGYKKATTVFFFFFFGQSCANPTLTINKPQQSVHTFMLCFLLCTYVHTCGLILYLLFHKNISFFLSFYQYQLYIVIYFNYHENPHEPIIISMSISIDCSIGLLNIYIYIKYIQLLLFFFFLS